MSEEIGVSVNSVCLFRLFNSEDEECEDTRASFRGCVRKIDYPDGGWDSRLMTCNGCSCDRAPLARVTHIDLALQKEYTKPYSAR